MFPKERFGNIMNFLMNVVMGISLTVTGGLLSNTLTLVSFLSGFVTSMGIGYLIGDFLPAKEWGDKLADAMGLKSALLHHLVSILILTVVMISIISFLCQFTSLGTMVFQIWPTMILKLIGVGYIVLALLFPVMFKLTISLTGFDPQKQ